MSTPLAFLRSADALYDIKKATTKLGRGKDVNDIVLDDRSVSTAHAVIEVAQNGGTVRTLYFT